MTHMSTNRTARRIVTLSATVALVATAPGLVGIASANDTPSPTVGATHAQLTLAPALITAIQDARNAFKTTARAASDTYRTAKAAIRAAMDADTSLTQLHAAKDAARQALELALKAGTGTPALQTAYDNARTAYEAAKAPYRTQEDVARNNLRMAVDAAKAVYVAAVKAAFATYAPTAAIPANLLEVSGKHHGYAFGHLNAMPTTSHAGGHMKPNHAASLHMVGNHR